MTDPRAQKHKVSLSLEGPELTKARALIARANRERWLELLPGAGAVDVTMYPRGTSERLTETIVLHVDGTWEFTAR